MHLEDAAVSSSLEGHSGKRAGGRRLPRAHLPECVERALSSGVGVDRGVVPCDEHSTLPQQSSAVGHVEGVGQRARRRWANASKPGARGSGSGMLWKLTDKSE